MIEDTTEDTTEDSIERSLRRSYEERARLIQKYGGTIPTTILKRYWSDRAVDLSQQNGRTYYTESDKSNLERLKNKGYSLAKINRIFNKIRLSGASCRGKKGGLSRFPQNIGRTLIRFYSEPGETVFDPFAGHNSRMELVHEIRRNYIGYDVSKEFMKANYIIKEMILGNRGQRKLIDDNKCFIELKEKDSRYVDLPNESMDFIITSPPYYDLEWYGDEEEQLGKAKTYEEFLDELLKVTRECCRVLKKGKFCVFFVNDFRTNRKFYTFHSDTIDLFKKAGFFLWDIAIVDLGTAIRAAFATQVESSKILPKQHEYVIIGKKIKNYG